MLRACCFDFLDAVSRRKFARHWWFRRRQPKWSQPIRFVDVSPTRNERGYRRVRKSGPRSRSFRSSTIGCGNRMAVKRRSRWIRESRRRSISFTTPVLDAIRKRTAVERWPGRIRQSGRRLQWSFPPTDWLLGPKMYARLFGMFAHPMPRLVDAQVIWY